MRASGLSKLRAIIVKETSRMLFVVKYRDQRRRRDGDYTCFLSKAERKGQNDNITLRHVLSALLFF